MKKIFYIMAISLFASCSNGLNKPIIETLTVDELKANIKKDSTFTDFYKGMQEVRDWLLTSDLNQAEWGDVTYSQIKDYTKESQDTVYFKELEDEVKPEWEQKYGNYDSKVDSIITYWAEFKKNNSVSSYVKIEFKKLSKEYYSYSNNIKSVNLGFKITPLKGKIEQLIFAYNIKSKIENKEKGNNIFSILDRNRCLVSNPISRPTILYWEAGYSEEKTLQYMSTSDVERDYDFNIEVLEVRVNGKNLEDDNLGIPESVDNSITYDRGYWRTDIIKELIDPDYIAYYEVIQKKNDERMKEYDGQVHSLLAAFNKQKYGDY